jgi:hypothetical protein
MCCINMLIYFFCPLRSWTYLTVMPHCKISLPSQHPNMPSIKNARFSQARVQRLLLKSQRARDTIWQEGVSQGCRQAVIQSYQNELQKLLTMTLTKPEERRQHLRFIKHQDWIFTFMNYPDVPPDNNSSERASPRSKTQGEGVWWLSLRVWRFPICTTPFIDSNLAQAALAYPCVFDGCLQRTRSASFLVFRMRQETAILLPTSGPAENFLHPGFLSASHF